MTNQYEGIKTAIIYGAGSGGEKTFNHLKEHGIEVMAFIDDFKEGEYLGKPIIKLYDLDKYEADGYFVGTAIHCRIFQYFDRLKNKVKEDTIYMSFYIPAPSYEDAITRIPPENYKDFLYIFEDNDFKYYLKESYNFCLHTLDKLQKKFIKYADIHNYHPFLELDQHRSYSYPQINFDVEEGDIVLNCGANSSKSECEHATYFASKSRTGKVYAFEPIPRIYNEFLEDIRGYDNIISINKGVWSENTVAYFEDFGGASAIKADGKIRVELIKIDDFVRENNIERVNFINMDIEGAELEALKGAEWTIRTFKPKLVISIYHKPEHFYEIPQYIKSIAPEYKMWVLNNEPHPWVGTKVFCRVE